MSRSKGFVFVELAIALPLLILLVYTLANVGIKIFELGRNQLADYVLEEEAHRLLERIVHQARAAKEITAYNESNGIKIVYRAADDGGGFMTIDEVWETQYFLTHEKRDPTAKVVYAEHQSNMLVNPITGANSFGETSLVSLQFSELNENVLRITLEMESLVTKRRIKLSTAVYMSACESKSGLPHE